MTRSRSTSGLHALLVATGILLSRLAGLVREQVFAHFLGNSVAAGAFRAALRIPNVLQNLFGEGVLSASFIPVYSRLLGREDDELAGRVAGVVGAVLALGVAIAASLGVLASPWLVDLIAPGFTGAARDLSVRIVRILFPGTGLLVLSAWCLGILNSHRKFFLSYAAPVLWNAAMIATLVAFGRRVGQGDLAVLLAWGMVVGSALQLGLQLPFVFRHARHLRFGLAAKLEPVREVFRNLAPVVAGRGVVQVSAFVDSMIASFLGTAAVSALGYAQTLYLLPISLFGMSVAAAELPSMAASVGRESDPTAALAARLGIGLRRVAFLVVPSAVAFLAFGDLLVAAIYQSGHFDAADSLFVGTLLAGSAIGLVPACLGRLYSSTLYALGDTRTPLRTAAARLSLAAALGALLAFPLRPLLLRSLEALGLPLPEGAGARLALGALGLTLASGIATWLELALLRRAVAARIGQVSIAGGFVLRTVGAALVGGLATIAVRPALARFGLEGGAAGHFGTIVRGGLAALTFGGVYLALTALFGLPEVRGVLRRLRRSA